MRENVIRFPSYFVPEDRNGAWHGGEFFKSFTDLVRSLTERERQRMTRWHIAREGRANYRAAVLCSDNDAAFGETGGSAA